MLDLLYPTIVEFHDSRSLLMILTFIGHRDTRITEKLKKEVRTHLRNFINLNVKTFYCGGMGAFDNLCAELLKELKEEFPHIKRYLVVPYLDNNFLRIAQELVSTNYYDEILYPPIENVFPKYAILARNKYMIDKADLLISFVSQRYGGAYQSFLYAKKKKSSIQIINLGSLN